MENLFLKDEHCRGRRLFKTLISSVDIDESDNLAPFEISAENSQNYTALKGL